MEDECVICKAPLEYRAADEPMECAVKTLGRTYTADDGTIWCGHSGTGVEFDFEGTELSFDLQGDEVFEPAPGELDETGQPARQRNARLAIYVDGQLQQELFMNTLADRKRGSNTKHIEVFRSSKPVKAHVKLMKLSENAHSAFGIAKIGADDGARIVPAASKELKIEFVGDSVTCAAGNEGQPSDPLASPFQNFSTGYAYQTAEQLGADLSVQATSGIGVLSGASLNTVQRDRVMAAFYENYGQSRTTYGGLDPASLVWDFGRFTPDVVVINLGTNDEHYVENDPQRVAAFEDAYIELIQLVRANNPNARIVCASGMMGTQLTGAVRDAVARYARESGDTRCTFFQMQNHAAEDGTGSAGHPNVASHAKAADELTAFISALLG